MMYNQREIFNLVKAVSGQKNILTIPRLFVKYTGSLEAGVFLAQALYWSDRGSDGEWFYKTYDDWRGEVCLSEYQVRKVANVLKKRGILETMVKKVYGNPTLHYRIDIGKLTDELMEFVKPEFRNIVKRRSRAEDADLTDPFWIEDESEKMDKVVGGVQ